MTTDKTPRQSSNHRIVRAMAVAMLVILAMAFGLYAFAAWSAATINCAEGSPTPQYCDGARHRMQVFSLLTIGAFLAAIFAWKKLDA